MICTEQERDALMAAVLKYGNSRFASAYYQTDQIGTPKYEREAEQRLERIRAMLAPPDDAVQEFTDDELDAFTGAIEAEVALSGGMMGGSHPHVFAVHAISWLEDAGFRVLRGEATR
jgi:hypothetical protein